MEHLMYSLEATGPVFLLMLCGMLFRKLGLFRDGFVQGANAFVFQIALPVNLFVQLSAMDVQSVWDPVFVLFCMGVTVVCIFVAALVARLCVPGQVRGEFIQASYRSSASLLGMAYMENLYGEASAGALMMLGSVSVYNIAAVLVLSLVKPEGTGTMERGQVRSLARNVATNPILLGVVIGFLWGLVKIPMPTLLSKTLENIGKTATPLGLLAMGAQVEFGKMRGRLKDAALASALKLVGFVLLFVPLAILLGFRREKLIAIVVMLGSATTVAAYVMARNMGHEGVLTQAACMITTLLSSFTLTGWIAALRALGYV